MATGPTVEREVEAPEVFSVTEDGLWDGRPSLGGIWVAHPDVAEPERVIIRNSANGQSTIGALFRRERENPGPALQVSSDAAEELGMLAGAPAPLSVIALRRVDSPADVAPAAIADFDAPEEIVAEPLDPVIAGADAAIGVADSAISAPVASAPLTPAAPPTPPASPTVPASSGGLEKPFVQIGIFSVEANAAQTAERLRANGLSARVLDQTSQDRRFWRVVIGPSPTAADRDAVIAQVEGLGFSDAYAVTN